MKTRIAALTLALVMVFALLSGCGQTAAQPSAPAETEAAAPTEAEAPGESAPIEEEAPAYPFPVDETVNLTYMNTFNPGMAGILDGWNAVATVEEYEKMTNVHVEYMNFSPDVFSEQFNLLLVAGELPDLVENAASAYTGGISGGITDGYFADLLDYAENMPCYMSMMENSDTLKKAAYLDSETIGCFYQVMEPTNVNGCIIRGDYLDKTGLDAPVTYDDTHEVLLAMQSEAGVAHPLVIPSFLDYQWNCFAGNYNTVGSFDMIGMSQQLFVVDGTVRYGMYTDEYEQYVTMLANWYSEDLIDPDFIYYEMVRDYQDKITAGEVGYYLNDLSNLEATQQLTEEAGADWRGITLPVQTAGQVNHLTNYYESVSTLGSVSISAACENIPVAVAWMDYKMTDEISFMFDFGIEGQTFNYGPDGEIQWTDLIIGNENLTLQQALTIYTGNEGGSAERNMSLYTDRQRAAVENWQTNVDGDYIYPTNISLDAETSGEVSTLLGDIRTYIAETALKFVTGEKPLEDFADFRAQMKTMGMDKVIEIYQKAYDDYMAK